MNFKIVCDSTANLVELEKIPFESVPLKIRTDEMEFMDDKNADIEKMLNHLKTYKGKSSTACPSPDEYVKAFGDAEYIFCITISSQLSGSYNSARIAKDEYESLYQGRKVFVIDSLSAGPGLSLIAEKLEELILADKSFEDICNEITEYHKCNRLVFSLESLTNLANNGRVSHSVARIAGILGIRLICKASDHGTIEPTDKARGDKKAIDVLFKNMKSAGFCGGKVNIDHCENMESATALKNKILEEFPKSKIKIGINRALCSFYAEKGGIIAGFEI